MKCFQVVFHPVNESDLFLREERLTERLPHEKTLFIHNKLLENYLIIDREEDCSYCIFLFKSMENT